MAEIALVRHGKYSYDNGHLVEAGKRQADDAAAKLVRGRRFLGAVILTSPVPRALETAERIAPVVGEEEGTVVIAHRALQVAGEHPESMPNLRAMTRAIMAREVPGVDYDGRIVVVTHLPLIAAMMGIEDADQVPNGSVHYYDGDGANSQFRPEFARPLDSVLEMRA